MDARSERSLVGVHPDLVRVVREAYVDWTSDGMNSFVVIEGIRAVIRQAELFKAGASMTMDSRHITGHAVDLACMVNGEIRWDWPLYFRLAAVMKSTALRLGVDLVAGADWAQFRDGPHYELSRRRYPVELAA